jgi:hypothetical protein
VAVKALCDPLKAIVTPLRPLPERVTCPEIAGHSETVNRVLGVAGTFTVEENSGIGPLLEYEANCGLNPLNAAVARLGEPGTPVEEAEMLNASESIAEEFVLVTSQTTVTLLSVPLVTAVTVFFPGSTGVPVPVTMVASEISVQPVLFIPGAVQPAEAGDCAQLST